MEKHDKTEWLHEQSRAILRNSDAPQPFQLECHPPSEKFAPYFDYYWRVEWDIPEGQTHKQRVLTFPNVQISFEKAGSFVHGLLSRAYERDLQGADWVAGIRLRIGAMQPFLQGAVSNITDKVLDACEVFQLDMRTLNERIRAKPDLPSMAREIERAFEGHLPVWDENVRWAENCVMLCDFEPDEAPKTVEKLADLAGLNIRQLQRLFHDYVGVSPKWVLSRARLHEAVARIETERNADLARIAADLGYYDQAHMSRDFAQYVLNSPDRYRKQIHG